jgi:hypothetical protein
MKNYKASRYAILSWHHTLKKKLPNFYMSLQGIPSLSRQTTTALSKSFVYNPMCVLCVSYTLLSNGKVRRIYILKDLC